MHSEGKTNITPSLPSKRTKARLLKAADLTDRRHAQSQTKARAEAGADMANFVSFAAVAMELVYYEENNSSRRLHPAVHTNIDAVRYHIKHENEQVVESKEE